MTETPESAEARIDACQLAAAILRGEPSTLSLNDGGRAGRVIVALARMAATEMYARLRDSGLSDEDARRSAQDHLDERVLGCELTLLAAGRLPSQGSVTALSPPE